MDGHPDYNSGCGCTTMNPCDALTKDYGMYYDGVWMKHDKLGVGLVKVDCGKLKIDVTRGVEPSKLVKAKDLTCWWPRPGAFNIDGKGRAVYIARRAMRNMRKSSVGGDHYFIKWGQSYNVPIMIVLKNGPNPVPLYEAMEMIDGGKESIAVSRDIIITSTGESKEYEVIFRGLTAGTYKHGCYEPGFSDSPLTGRVMRQLEAR